jgi:hypothetical protein
MTAKSDELVNELVAACIAFGRQVEPDWQTRIETALCALKAHIEELEAYRYGYDPENEFPPEGEWVWLRDCDDNIEPVQYDRKMEWYWNYGYNAKNFTTWDRLNGDIRRWYPIEKLPEVQE